MHNAVSHQWVAAPYQRDREHALNSIDQTKSFSYHIDCHRQLRGPYTGAGELLRRLVPEIHQRWADHVIAHKTEILFMAPELQSLVEGSPERPPLPTIAEGQGRLYSHLHTLRLAHGLTDFLLGFLALAENEHGFIWFENVHAADPLDQELIATLLRRVDPRRLLIVVSTTLEPLPEPLQSALTTYASPLRPKPLTIDQCQQLLTTWALSDEWKGWLLRHTAGWRGEWESLQRLSEMLPPVVQMPDEDTQLEEGLHLLVKQCPPALRNALVQSYISSECTSDQVLHKVAYDLADPVVRQQYHDDRAEALEALNQWSLHLGAIPYHCEHGQDPSDYGVQALQKALDYCINMGYHEATIDLGQRGRQVANWETQLDKYWIFTAKMATSLAALGRSDEAEALYKEIRSLTSDPTIHMQAAYATAIISTKHHTPEQRDHQLAKGWLQEAMAFAQVIPHAKESAFYRVFMKNALALIELHLNRIEEALRLVSEGLAYLDQKQERALELEEHRLYRSILLNNRARVYARLGQMEQALADATEMIIYDPSNSEFYSERGNLYQRLGRYQEALDDYNGAIKLDSSYPEAYYNRAGTLSLLGHDDEALYNYNSVLELDPSHIDALINRAGILYEREEFVAARQDVERGLALAPNNAQLLCTLGLIEMAEEHPREAYQALSSAIEHHPSLIEAWTNRAILAYESGNTKAAIDDLTSALALEQNATVLANRGMAYQSCGSWQEAIDDFTDALALADDDAQELLYQRGLCYIQMGNTELADRDFQAHLALGPSPYESELRSLML